MDVAAALAAARGRVSAGEARLLLRHILGASAAGLAAHPERRLDESEAARFEALLGRRAEGMPMAYLLGSREFYGRLFRVTPDVLIPRPETELLVELGLAKLAGIAAPRILELGTGSGCIAVSLACELPRSRVVAVDRSAAALAVARENAARHDTAVEFIESDWFAAVDGRFDLIVGNPPYVAAGDAHLAQGDLRFEPMSALASGADGLDAIRIILAAAPRHLAPGGWIFLEHGYDQAEAVARLCAAAGLAGIEQHRDLAGIVRASGGYLSSGG